MVFANLRSDERIGLGIALALHVALVGVLLTRPERAPVFEPQEKMTVNLSTDVGLKETAPDPVPESRAAEAPELSPEPAPVAEPAPAPEPAFELSPAPPRPVTTPAPAPPKPKPVPRATQAPKPKPSPVSTDPRRRPDTPSSRVQSTPAPAKPAAKPAARSAATRPAGASKVGSDFLAGAGESATTAETRVPASQIGASAKASLVQAIARKIKPKWQPPDGPDVDKITTFLRFRLNPDGSLSGRPEMVRQTGVNPINQAQAERHAEQAIRAVQLAAPFDLPDEYYEAWKLVGPFGFDWKLAQ